MESFQFSRWNFNGESTLFQFHSGAKINSSPRRVAYVHEPDKHIISRQQIEKQISNFSNSAISGESCSERLPENISSLITSCVYVELQLQIVKLLNVFA